MKLNVKTSNKKLFILPVLAILVGFGGFFLATRHNEAEATMVGWDAGNIMSDFVMGNRNTMTAAQIDAWVKNKITCNQPYDNTIKYYQSLGYEYHVKDNKVVCIADEYEWFGNKTVGQVIYNTAQAYSINPQVLLVMIGKESALLNDTWPNRGQYNKALGFGCPDTAPCDPAFSGFEIQVRKAAELFRNVLNGGWTNYPVGSNYVQYNPDPSCGGSWVNIQNRATSALYRYTPYQPNPATLAVAPGKTAPCGAYGNKNFYHFFTEWFGDTRGNTVAHEAIVSRHQALGGSGGVLGSPAGAVTEHPDGRVSQYYQKGVIVWRKETGAWESINGPIRDRWAALGGSGGVLGSPAGAQETRSGVLQQNFQRGEIYWTQTKGSWYIIY